jgi:hypothetical protein
MTTTTITRKTRLISAQGPAQLINVLAILKYQDKNESPCQWEDHLVLGGFSTELSPQITQRMVQICEKIASIWNFKSLHYLSNEDLSIECSFHQTAKRLRKELNLTDVEYIYVCRNWQLFNELLLESYQDARKVAYGDGFGLLDLSSKTRQPRPFNPSGYYSFEKAYLFMPLEVDPEGKSFSLVNQIIQPPIDYLIDTIKNIGSNLPEIREYSNFMIKDAGNKIILVTTSNFTESNSMKDNIFSVLLWKLFSLLIKFSSLLGLLKIFKFLDKFVSSLRQIRENIDAPQIKRKVELEACMYFEQIVRHAHEDELILIKPHPRELFKQSVKLVDRLFQNGYKATVIDHDFSCFPVELFFLYLPFSKVIALDSTSALTGSLFCDSTDSQVFPFIDSDLKKRYMHNRLINSVDDSSKKVMVELLKQVKARKFSPIRANDL